MNTMEDTANAFPRNNLDEFVFPVLSECYVNIQTEKGDDWGGLERCGFTESQLSKNIHTVTISLCSFYDDDGVPSNNCEDAFMIVESDFPQSFGFSMTGEKYGGRIDPKEMTTWFLNHKKAENFANDLFCELKKLGYKPIKKYNW